MSMEGYDLKHRAEGDLITLDQKIEQAEETLEITQGKLENDNNYLQALKNTRIQLMKDIAKLER